MDRTGDLWDTGAVDIIGSLMVIVLKQVAIAHNISDAKSPRVATFTAERKALLLEKPPSLLQYLSFMFASGNLLAGPFNEYRDYASFTARTGAHSTGQPIAVMLSICM
jgi:lysophospholipid acyltransferase